MSLGDTLAGLHAAFGVVMALLHRQRHQNKVPGQVCLLCTHYSAHNAMCERQGYAVHNCKQADDN